MKKLLLLTLFLPGISFAAKHVQQGSSFVVGQCLQADTGDSASTTGAACGSGGGGPTGLINNATQYSDAYYSISGSSNVISGLTPDQTKLFQMVFWNNGVPTFGDAPGFSMPDGTAFTTLVTSMNPVGGVFNDSLATLGSTAAGAFRMTPNRAEHVSLRDGQGVAIGTGTASPIYVYQTNPSTVSITGSVFVSTIQVIQSTVGVVQVTSPWVTSISGAPTVFLATTSVSINGSSNTIQITGTPTVTFNGINQPVRITDNQGVILGTSTANPFYTFITNPSTVPINVSISSGSGPSGTILTLSGRVSPQTVGTIKNSTDTIAVFVSSFSNVTFMITPGTSTGITANFETSIDSGTNWVALICNRVSTYNTESSFTLDTTTNVWTGSVIGATNFRVRSSAWSAGIATVTIQVTGDPVSQSISVGQPIASQLQTSANINGSSNTVKVIQSTVGVVTTGIGLQVVSTQTFSVQPIGVTTVTFNGTAQPIITTQTITVTAGTGTFTVQPVGITTVTHNGIGQPVTSTSTFIINTPTVTFNGVGQPVTSTSTVIVNIPTVTFNNVGQPVTSTYTVIVASNIYNNTLAAATTGLTILSADENQRLLVTGIPRGQIRQATATLTTNTEIVFIPSGAAGIFNDLCGCIFSNTSAIAVRIDIRGQGNGGTINNNFYLPAGDTRGFWPGCQNPFVQLSPASNWTVQLSGSVTDVRVTCQYIPLK